MTSSSPNPHTDTDDVGTSSTSPDAETLPLETPCPASASRGLSDELLTSCVHCGFCLEVCPTYQLSGDENNSPRGRLRLWRAEAEGKLPRDAWTDFYTEECVGCLACEPACPANVPYGEILEHVRREHVVENRSRPRLAVRLAGYLAAHPRMASLLLAPARLLRSVGGFPGRWSFVGSPAVVQSTAAYARSLMERHRPNGPRVALLTGCIMEALFRELNFATVRVLIENNVQVTVPADQGCCGAFQEHAGLGGLERLRARNRTAFADQNVDAVVSNSSGCGFALGKSLSGGPVVRDVLAFLGELDPVRRTPSPGETRVYVDLPCHLVHGQRVAAIPQNILDATGLPCELAPRATDCCGSGGTYHLSKPENAREILRGKAEFLNDAGGDPVVLATSNHVCMMQWNAARSLGIVHRPFVVRHLIQLLDPGEAFKVNVR